MNNGIGGYDDGYRNCPCFWGKEPGSYVKLLSSITPTWDSWNVLDVGCGEGKNSAFAARNGATVHAWDISQHAISNAEMTWGNHQNIEWKVNDIRTSSSFLNFDLVIAYGILHCLKSQEQIEETVDKIKSWTMPNGYNVICSFNRRSQDLSAHPGFTPCLIDHEMYLSFYNDWEILFSEDRDLHETHPHNGILHHHSLTRLIARKVIR